jgi:Ca2+-binding RTX toxin-like protein
MSTVFTGTDFHEVINGSDGDDTIIGLAGYDTLNGGEGSDTYIVNAGDFQNRFVDFYQDSGTTGVDVILAAEAGVDIGLGDGFSALSSGIEIINGLEGSRIVGDNDNQTWDFTGVEILGVSEIFGAGGMDHITGTSGADTILGGSGFDQLYGGRGRDTLMGGEDSDHLYGENGRDVLFGEAGHDVLDGGRAKDMLFGGDGHDMLYGGDGHDWLYGDAGHDKLYGGEGRDRLFGGEGYDYLDGGEGADRYYVGLDDVGFVDEYNDTGTSGRDRIIALEDGTVIGLMTGFALASGIEVIAGARHDNVTIGGTNDAEIWDFTGIKIWGIDGIYAGDGMDVVTGTNRRDNIFGEAGSDQIFGAEGHDRLHGGEDSDFLFGGVGNDRLFGDSGNDVLDGGVGRDRLTGGEGYDIFKFGPDSGRDRVMDFNASEDLLDFSAFGDDFGFDDLTIVQRKNGVRINFGDDESVFLHDVDVDDLSVDLFVF